MTATTGPNTPSWLSAHGKLWYDDPLYRIAWIVWPQAIGLALFVGLWLAPPGGLKPAPWAKPIVQTPANQPTDRQVPVPPQQALPQQVVPPKFVPPPLAQQPADPLAPCKSGNYSQIIQTCTALLAYGNLKGADLATGYRSRAWAYYQNNQYQLAMNDYNKAISINPGEADFFNDRGLTWMALGNNDRAMQDYEQASLLSPRYAIPYYNKGLALNNLKRPNEALTAFSAAIERDPNMWSAYEYRALIYEQRSDWRGCYDDGTKMIAIKPNDQLGYGYRGRAYLEVGQIQPAINDFTKGISLAPNEVYNYRWRGRAYYLLNQLDTAMVDYKAALQIAPNDEATISFLNDLKRRQNGR